MILLLAGTTEGRRIAIDLERQGVAVMASTATTYGLNLLREGFKGSIYSAPLGLEALVEMIKTKDIVKVVDATHPYATKISENAREACRKLDIPYERVEREKTAIKMIQGKEVIPAADINEAAAIAASFEGNIFLTTGSSKLEDYLKVIDADRLVVRILPVAESLEKCLKLKIKPANIIAMQGPFEQEINEIIFKRYNAAVVISKESGPAGGVAEKISAAKSLNIPVILISRPH
jgi:precorrin-6A/cobalt-precorrin-6A reductase